MRFLWHFVRDNKITMLKYGTIGASSTIIDFGFYVLFVYVLGAYYLLAATLSFIMAAVFNFTFNRNWTFQSNGQKRKQLPVFLTVMVLGVFLNNTIIALGVEVLGLWDIFAKVISTGMVTIWNFLGNKYITFKVK